MLSSIDSDGQFEEHKKTQDETSVDPSDFKLSSESLFEDGDGSATDASMTIVPSFDFSYQESNLGKAAPLVEPDSPRLQEGPIPGATLSPAQCKMAPNVSAPAAVLYHHPDPTAASETNQKRKRRRLLKPSMEIASGPTNSHLDLPAVTNTFHQRGQNRIRARRPRLRQKSLAESLQKEVNNLQRESRALKEIVRKKLEPNVPRDLLGGIKAKENSSRITSVSNGGSGSKREKQNFSFTKSLACPQLCCVITDPSLPDNPIVAVSDGFLSLTGYARDKVIGRSCRFLQGAATCPVKLGKVRNAISEGKDVTVTVLNYTADGTAFWNKLFVSALRDMHTQSNIVKFVGVVVKVNAPETGDPGA